MNRKILCYFLSILAFLAQGALMAGAEDYVKGDLTITNVWARAMPDAARVGSGFMEINNQGQAADRLLAVRSNIAERIEIHSMEMEGEVMKMRALDEGLEISSQSHVVLKPGGYHLMFFNPQTQFKQGDHFQAELVFEKAGSVAVTFDIKALGSKTDQHDHAH